MPEEKLADVKGATLTADGTGVVFDVPAADVEDYIQGNLFPCLPNDEWLGTKCFFSCCAVKFLKILLLCDSNQGS